MENVVLVELTQEIVRELLDYDPDTGILTWRKRDIKWFKETEHRSSTWICNTWNSSFANKEAFTSQEVFGYRQGHILSKRYKAHRVIWLYMTGEWPNVIDHINGVTWDNRWCNLRNVDVSTNTQNAMLRVDNKSGYKGVGWAKREGKWRSRIKLNGKEEHLGYFDTPEQAHEAYVSRAKELGFTDRHIFGVKA